MAELLSVQSEIRPSVRLLREASPPDGPPEAGRGSAQGKFSSKDLDDSRRGLDELIEYSRALRFEPSDLIFYSEWSHEPPLVFLIVTWFALALSPRRFDRRF